MYIHKWACYYVTPYMRNYPHTTLCACGVHTVIQYIHLHSVVYIQYIRLHSVHVVYIQSYSTFVYTPCMWCTYSTFVYTLCMWCTYSRTVHSSTLCACGVHTVHSSTLCACGVHTVVQYIRLHSVHVVYIQFENGIIGNYI